MTATTTCPPRCDEWVITTAGPAPVDDVAGRTKSAAAVYAALLAAARTRLPVVGPASAPPGWQLVSVSDSALAAATWYCHRSIRNARRELLAAGVVQVLAVGTGRRVTCYVVPQRPAPPADAYGPLTGPDAGARR